MFCSMLDTETVPRRNGHRQFDPRHRFGGGGRSYWMFYVLPGAQKSKGLSDGHLFTINRTLAAV